MARHPISRRLLTARRGHDLTLGLAGPGDFGAHPPVARRAVSSVGCSEAIRMRAQSASPNSSSTVGVVLVEPFNVVRAGLDLLISSASGLQVLAETGDAVHGLQAIRRLRSRGKLVALAGLELIGEFDALWLVRAIREEFPQVVVLVTGTDVDRVAISRALFVGADGFIHKDSPPERFVEAIRRAAYGEIVLEGLPRGALGTIVEGFDRHRSTASLLTTREVQILAVAAEGLSERTAAWRRSPRQCRRGCFLARTASRASSAFPTRPLFRRCAQFRFGCVRRSA